MEFIIFSYSLSLFFGLNGSHLWPKLVLSLALHSPDMSTSSVGPSRFQQRTGPMRFSRACLVSHANGRDLFSFPRVISSRWFSAVRVKAPPHNGLRRIERTAMEFFSSRVRRAAACIPNPDAPQPRAPEFTISPPIFIPNDHRYPLAINAVNTTKLNNMSWKIRIRFSRSEFP